ncbi:MAG: LruC domain-containing protein [Prevotellaceae bacterium]|jgi:LruC domain-containing protein|nr:LruC domain-containing protein [Prevotellaceae bacterium]
MNKSDKIYHAACLLVLVAISVVWSGCVKDVLNKEIIKATYEDKFPVKDIDPLMDWKTTKQVSVSVAVYEDRGVDYVVEVYDHNPLDSTVVAHLLANGISKEEITGQAMPFNTVVTCPAILDTLYVGRIDPVGRRVYQVAPISNGQIHVEFGNGTITTRASTRAITITPPLERPYTDADIATMLANADEYISGTQLDADILAGIADSKVFKITKSTPFSLRISKEYPAGTIKLIIAEGANAVHELKETIPGGVEIIVASGATLHVGSGSQRTPSMTFISNSRLVVLGGENPGRVTGTGWLEFNNPGINNYNGGIVDGFDGFNNKGGTFFNNGTIIAKSIIDEAPDIPSLFVNYGCLDATSNIGESATNAPIIENGCKVIGGSVTGGSTNGKIYTAGLTLTAGASVHCGDLFAYNYVNMGNNSILRSDGSATFTNCTVQGETSGDYALLKLNSIKKSNKYSFRGRIYIEANSSITKTLSGVSSNGVTFAKPGNAPVLSDATDCTIENYPETSPEVIEPEPLINYTYVYEDNFPMVGDYDFNDVVFDVTITYDRNSSNNITATRLGITLTALGATKTLGAGLRIVGINKSLISQVSYQGADVARFRNTLAGSLFGTDIETANTYLTIPLFGNGHTVLDVPAGTMVNTGGSGTTASPRSFEVVLTQSQTNSPEPLITKDNLDFFIAYRYRNMQQRVEVHLYEFWNYGATATGTIQQENLDLAGNNTWAICVPEFRYPKEGINICDDSNSNNSAHPRFLNWARDRSVNQDWYLYPNENNVYR